MIFTCNILPCAACLYLFHLVISVYFWHSFSLKRSLQMALELLPSSRFWILVARQVLYQKTLHFRAYQSCRSFTSGLCVRYVSQFASFERWSLLSYMMGRRMQISAFPSEIMTLQQLQILDLSQNFLQLVPEVISLSLLKIYACTRSFSYQRLVVAHILYVMIVCWSAT